MSHSMDLTATGDFLTTCCPFCAGKPFDENGLRQHLHKWSLQKQNIQRDRDVLRVTDDEVAR